ncbi:YihY/virulence factor BrkB family protein [Streptacidiphilus sp. N1-12]|uniref:YihY/virulence factor BrkB family protein n=2 Tax=Streptacidiphilus alkalitolerans TaxID=3342712 RepID=A0ABV6V5M1_9ACTN
MDWLTRLPVIGPVVSWVLRTRPYRVYQYVNEVGGNRLAGAVTFFGFLALFPLLTVAMAAAAASLSAEQVRQLQSGIEKQVPALAQSLDLDSLVRNAGTVGLVSGVLLLVSGLGWVDTTRVSIRTVWRLPIEPGNAVIRKVLDVGVLIGLGLVGAVSIGASSVTTALAGQAARWAGVEHSGWGSVLLSAAGYVIAVAADTLIFAYLLVGLPRIADQSKRVVLQGALLGAVGFEVLKLALSAYLGNVAGKSMYGAFGTPVALLLWIDFIFRLLFFCVAWTACADPDAAAERARQRAEEALTAAAALAATLRGTPAAAPASISLSKPPPAAGPSAVAAPPPAAAGRGRQAQLAAAFLSGAAALAALRRLRKRLRR